MILVVGIGARRGVSEAQVRAALAVVDSALTTGDRDAAHHIRSTSGPTLYASVEAKAGEAGILAAIAPAPLHTRPAQALATVPAGANPLVEAATGTPSVAEAAALLVAGEHGSRVRLVVPKTVVGPVTVAAALADTPEG